MPALDFTYDLTTDQGMVRLLIQDNDIATARFADAEIAAFVSRSGNVYGAAALACDVLALRAAANPVREEYGDEKRVYLSPEHYRSLADAFRKSALAGTLTIGEITDDTGAFLDTFSPLWETL
jgi:hypothetical protein